MLRALAIHFIGFYAINSLMPAWAQSADADLLSVWYASFALVDLIGLILLGRASGILESVAQCALVVSMLWSAALSVEMAMLQDLLQQADTSMQGYFDMVMGVTMIIGVIQQHRQRTPAIRPIRR
jgi:hypothetical protein